MRSATGGLIVGFKSARLPYKLEGRVKIPVHIVDWALAVALWTGH